MRTARYYIFIPSLRDEGKYEISGWARTQESANSRKGDNGFVVYAYDRPQARRRAFQWYGAEMAEG